MKQYYLLQYIASFRAGKANPLQLVLTPVKAGAHTD